MDSRDIKNKIAELQEELRKTEQKEKAKQGSLKFGEFCLVTFYEYDDNDKKVQSECDPIVFFMPWGQDNPVPMQECYIDWYTPYFVDLKGCANSWEEIKVKKISRDEAFAHMKGSSK